MSHVVALWIAALVAGFFLLDAYLLHWGAGLAALGALTDLIRWLAFWR